MVKGHLTSNTNYLQLIVTLRTPRALNNSVVQAKSHLLRSQVVKAIKTEFPYFVFHFLFFEELSNSTQNHVDSTIVRVA